MKIFVTGGTGYIGNAVARALRRAGHDVSALVRTEEKAKTLWADEVRPVLGDLRKPESFERAARDADAIVHCAAEHSKEAPELDRATVERLLAICKEGERRRTFVYTSGVWIYGNTGGARVNENSAINPLAIVTWRPPVEKLVLDASSDRVRASIARPGCVFGGSGGLTGSWFETAEKEGAARVIGDGNNRWAMIHVEDLAAAYVRLVHAQANREIFNITDRSRATLREMAAAATRAAGRGSEIKLIPVAEASKTMRAAFAEALAVDQHIDSWKAVEQLGWNPRFGGFADDAEVYFSAWKNRASRA